MTRTSGGLTVERRTYGRNVITWAGGGATSTRTLTRTTTFADGRVESVPIVGAVSVPSVAPDVWVDGDVPFGMSVTSITYEFGAASVVVPAEKRRWSVLSDPFTGVSCNVVGTELGDRSWRSATTVAWREVAVHGDPAVHARPEQRPTQNLTVLSGSRFASDTIAALCASRRPLLLRSPESGVDDMWFVLVGDRTEQRVTPGNAHYEIRRHSWDMHTITRPDPKKPDRHTLNTLGDISGFIEATVPKPVTYAWTGTPNASPSTMTSGGVTVTNLVDNPTPRNSTNRWTAGAGGAISTSPDGLLVTVAGGGAGAVVYTTQTLAPTGVHVSGSVRVTLEGPAPVGLYVRMYSYGENQMLADSGVTTVQPGETVDLVALGDKPVGATSTGVRLIVYANASWVDGSSLLLTNAIKVTGQHVPDYFDGDTPETYGPSLQAVAATWTTLGEMAVANIGSEVPGLP